MARGPASFKQRDVTRAVRGAVAAGVEVQRIEIDKTGKIVIVTGKPLGERDGNGTSWDRALSHEAH
jgi:hypothetical protein